MSAAQVALSRALQLLSISTVVSGFDAIKAHCSISAIRLRPTAARARVPT
jgi:hypothetical protein